MNKYIVILNTVKYNRGSEALARGISEIIRSKEPDAQIYIVSNDVDIEKQEKLPGTVGYIRKSSVLRNDYIKAAFYIFLKKVVCNRLKAAKFRYSKLFKECQDTDTIICVGGDNYDIRYGMLNNLHELHSLLRNKCNAKMVMYDCSLGKEDLVQDVIRDLEQFDEVTVRECVSENNLRSVYAKKNVSYYPDPAFAMPPEECELPKGWKINKMVGINLSGLVLDDKYGGNSDLVFNAYRNMVRKVIEFGYIPVFIPHVMNGQDYKPLEQLYKKCSSFGHIILLGESYNAAQLKYIISNCYMYVGARTHSTIAAYSSCVPTLVLGYSVKSVGIATDLFGTDENYVLSVDNLKNENQLEEAFLWLYDNRREIKRQLELVMPNYVSKAYDFETCLERLNK
jgi:polysaccharide pyruvyl transferase WcaK-like protein